MDESAAVRRQTCLALALLVLQPALLVAFGVVLPLLHSALLRCCRLRWPFWYSAIDLMHTCSWIPMGVAAIFLVCAHPLLIRGWGVGKVPRCRVGEGGNRTRKGPAPHFSPSRSVRAHT